jgi:hypothetical protein
MPDFSLVPVDHQPDFGDVSLVPVDHDPFSADGSTQQTQIQPAQFQPASSSQISATRTAQLNVGPPAIGDGTGGPPNGAAGGVPNSTQDQGAPPEPAPFSGYANPTPAESLVNKQKMNDQLETIKAHPNGEEGNDLDGGELYRFVTTKSPLARYLIDGGAGSVFTERSPFYAFDGTRYAIIDASPERPVTVRVPEGGKFTISRP